MDAIIFLDIRNFSAHREFLARTRAARPLSRLVKTLLEQASSLSKSYMRQHGMTQIPLLNHTGDGFVLVLRNEGSSIAALRFASEFREIAESLLQDYHEKVWATRMAEIHPAPPSLGYGIGMHSGKITAFGYVGVAGKATAFLGSAVNVASRVEGCTKDHPHPVLCTGALLRRARQELGKPAALGFADFFISLGLHNLRGLRGPVELIRCEPGLDKFLRTHCIGGFSL
jgi:class 3 adenylate cyclase